MESRKGFTLVELMVGILIVAILAATLVPICRGLIDSSKWSEGVAAMDTIATALQVYAAEKGADGNYGSNLPTFSELGFTVGDFKGQYFDISNYEVGKVSYKKGKLKYKIKATAPVGITTPREITLNEKGHLKQKK